MFDRICIFKEYCPAYSEYNERCDFIFGDVKCIPLLIENHLSETGDDGQRMKEMYDKYDRLIKND